jgi:hypothetical protein
MTVVGAPAFAAVLYSKRKPPTAVAAVPAPTVRTVICAHSRQTALVIVEPSVCAGAAVRFVPTVFDGPMCGLSDHRLAAAPSR